MSRKSRAQQIMYKYYDVLGPGPYYYDNSAVAAALIEAVEYGKTLLHQIH